MDWVSKDIGRDKVPFYQAPSAVCGQGGDTELAEQLVQDETETANYWNEWRLQECTSWQNQHFSSFQAQDSFKSMQVVPSTWKRTVSYVF